MRNLAEILKEARSLVKEADEFINEVSKTRMFDMLKSVKLQVDREYKGEVIFHDGEVEVVQEIRPGANVNVKYLRDGKIVVKFDDKEFVHEVGCVDVESIEAVKKYSTVVVKARRCGHAGEDKEPVQEEGSGGGAGRGGE